MKYVKHLILIVCLTFSSIALPKPLSSPTNPITCLTDTAYMEARGQGSRAMALVQDVVLNRVDDSRWPSSVCAVVYQRKQFSWSNKPVPMAQKPDDIQARLRGRERAIEAVQGVRLPTTSANHFLSPKALAGGRFPMWASCSQDVECVEYNKRKVRKPLFLHNGFWFYEL